MQALQATIDRKLLIAWDRLQAHRSRLDIMARLPMAGHNVYEEAAGHSDSRVTPPGTARSAFEVVEI